MRFFICLIDQNGAPISQAMQRMYEATARAHGLAMRWCTIGSLSALIAQDVPSEQPLLVHRNANVALGVVRLDNRADLVKLARCEHDHISDLELILRVVELHGTKRIPDMLGDFAFIAWNASTRTLIAACDAFAVKKLYYTTHGDLLAFASRGEALALNEEYDVQYLAELLAYCPPSAGHSPYAGVHTLPAGTIAVHEHGKLAVRRYWSAYDFEPSALDARSELEAADGCRQLLAEGVRSRLTGREDTWAQLSGGMDSSSVVSMAQWLTETADVSTGITGTVTYVDTRGTGADERQYSNAVVERYRLRNDLIIDCAVWEEDELGPPRVDQPSASYPYYVRDRRLCEIVRDAGGQALLTGQGGDELFAGNMFFFADWLVHGRVRLATREMARRAAIGRVSFWELAYRNAVLPLLPRIARQRLVRDEGHVPSWVTATAARRYELQSRASASRSYAGRIGRKYSDARAALVATIPAKVTTGIIEDALEVQHPYLYRPLVEFALRLPAELCVRPYARKWILREAMRGILPEQVRNRVGKGVLYGLLSWSIVKHRAYLEPLLREPILAQLGIIDAAKLQVGFAAAQYEQDGRTSLSSDVQYALAIEAWLRVRSGRWGREVHDRRPGLNTLSTNPQH